MQCKNGYWGESHGCELQGKRIGLLGYGNIGKTLAKRLSGFDVELLAFDKQPDFQCRRQRWSSVRIN
ncbi:hypothetical protein HTS61_16935 [Escherichia coli]|nr:hypothetical protein [Escherichia coli]